MGFSIGTIIFPAKDTLNRPNINKKRRKEINIFKSREKWLKREDRKSNKISYK